MTLINRDVGLFADFAYAIVGVAPEAGWNNFFNELDACISNKLPNDILLLEVTQIRVSVVSTKLLTITVAPSRPLIIHVFMSDKIRFHFHAQTLPLPKFNLLWPLFYFYIKHFRQHEVFWGFVTLL